MQVKLKFTGLIASVLMFSSSFSQVSQVKNVEPFTGKVSSGNDFSNVVIEFHKLFSNAGNVSWYSVDKNFGASFTVDDLMYRAVLNRRGKLIYKIAYGKEKHLPVAIRKMVKSSYVEFVITAAAFFEDHNRKIWLINLSDESRDVTVRVEDLEMSEILNKKF